MRRITTLVASAIAFLSQANSAFATSHLGSPNISGFETSGIPFVNLGRLLSNILALLFFFAALMAFLFILIGGIQWISAGGDKVAAASARDRITAAVVGLLIVVAAFAITLILSTVLGINLFEFNFPTAERTAGA